MSFSGKSDGGGGGGERWGADLLLVFFAGDPDSNNVDAEKTKKNNSNSCFSLKSLSAATTTPTNVLQPGNSNLLLSKAQSTISICALLVFTTLLLFTLCTIEPTVSAPNVPRISPRRRLADKTLPIFRLDLHSYPIRSIWGRKSPIRAKPDLSWPSALQGMGTLYMRGTKAMNDLVVCHVSENVDGEELRLFMRLLHRSGLTSRSDVVLVFPASRPSFDSVIQEENESFLKLVRRHSESTHAATRSADSFDSTQFVKSKSEEGRKEPLWGDRRGGEEEARRRNESTRWRYGSVVGFVAAELDPENTLAGFMDRRHLPMSLRRWACYPLLLGRVKRKFKHVILADVKNSALVRDPLGPIRSKSPESVLLWAAAAAPGSRKSSDQRLSPPTPAVIVGGTKGIRRLANLALVKIVRCAAQHKGKKSAVSESTLMSQLGRNELLLKNVDLAISAESTRHGVILRGDNNQEFDIVIKEEIRSYHDEH